MTRSPEPPAAAPQERLAQIEAARYTEQQILRALLDNLSEGIIACDRDGKIVFCNRTACDFFGLERPPTAIGTSGAAFQLYLSASDRPLSPADLPLRRILRGESLHNLELRAVPAAGPVRNLLASGDPIRDERGNCLGAVVALRDITQRKRAEAEILRLNAQLAQQATEGMTQLEAVNRLYRSVLRSISEVIFQTDLAGRWTFLSSPWTVMTGYKIDECLGCSFLDWVFADEDRLVLAQQFQATIAGDREAVEHEFRLLTRGGSFRWLEIYMQLERDRQGNLLGTSGAIDDIAERKQTEIDSSGSAVISASFQYRNQCSVRVSGIQLTRFCITVKLVSP